MDKKEKLLTISVKKAWIGGTIFTLIVSALYALLLCTFMLNGKEEWSTLCLKAVNTANSCSNSIIKHFIILWPVMITIIGTTLAGFLVIFNKKDK